MGELFTPKLVTVLREGYGWPQFRADAIAGLTVAIVALPLSMAIAIGSGLSPEKGLFAAIIGGLLISLLGGSRFQIGGPAGAFIVLIAAIVERHGYDGLLLATMLAGLIMITIGLLQLGTYIKYIPYPVTVGFTAGIAVIIFASQLKELLGLTLTAEPVALLPKLVSLWNGLPTVNPAAVALSAVTITIIVVLRRYRPKWPGFLISIAASAMLAEFLDLGVATIGSRFGEVPHMLPAPHLPVLDLAKIQSVLPDAVSIALLGSIESLLSAVVADGMTGRRHRSNCELFAQGIANIATAAFSGMSVTGTIARTATNVRAGAVGPVSGIMHAIYVLLFMAVAAPLAAHIPLAALGAVLAIVAWNMAERHEFAALLGASRGDAVVLLTTFLLTIFVDLSIAIGAGVTCGAFLFLHRLAQSVEVETGERLSLDDQADASGPARTAYTPVTADKDTIVYRISGAFFFGAAAAVGAALDRIGEHPKVFVLDFTNVPIIDATAAKTLERFVRKLHAGGTTVYLAAVRKDIRRPLLAAGLRKPLVRYVPTAADAATAPSLQNGNPS